MEQYCRHLLDQWLDRAVDGNYTEVSLRLAAAVSPERPLSSIGKELSSILVRADGADQAKFRVPRDNQRTHAFDTLLRPALHVQGCWAHGFGIHLAVADGDMKKDTNNNIEVIARLLNQIYLKHQGMPHAIVLLQDNTSRECNKLLNPKVRCPAHRPGLLRAMDERISTEWPLTRTPGWCLRPALRQACEHGVRRRHGRGENPRPADKNHERA